MDALTMTPNSVLKQTVNVVVWLLFIGICGLTLIVYIAQNSVPGDNTYSVKLGFEKVVLRASKIMNNEVNVQIEFTKRRLQETKKVLAANNNNAHATESLSNLTQQVEQTEQTILSMHNTQDQTTAAKSYINTLITVNNSLEQTKEAQNTIQPPTITTEFQGQNPPLLPSPTIISTVQPTAVPTKINTVAVTTTSLTPTQSVILPAPPIISPVVSTPPAITGQITQTQQTVQTTIEQLNTLVKRQQLNQKPEKDQQKSNNKTDSTDKPRNDDKKKGQNN